MKILFMCLFSTFVCVSQQNMDTIYGNPKRVYDKILILDKNLKRDFKRFSRASNVIDIDMYRKRSLVGFLEDNNNMYLNLKRKYSRNGLLMNQSFSDFNKDYNLTLKYEHDTKNRLIEENEISDKTDFVQIKNVYNSKDSIIASTTSFSILPNDIVHTYYYRNSENRMTHYKRVYNDGISVFFYDLNRDNKIIKKYRVDFGNNDEYQKLGDSIFLKNRELSLMEVNEYDENGNLILEKKYNEKSKLIFKRFSRFDKFNNLIYIEYSSRPNDVKSYTHIKFNYDKYNNKIEYSRLYENKYALENTKFYYENNLLSSTVTISGNQILKTDFKYKFDKHENWTEILKVVNGVKKYKWKRKISYYN